MQCYTELLPPTAVTHAVSLPFLSTNTNNLIVAKTSLLQVFELKDAPNASNGSAVRSKLSLIGEYPLSGTVTSLRSIALTTTASGGHALLVGLRDAKISLVEWDPENHRISTISIHYYEGDNVLLPPFGPSLKDCESSLTVDPSSRCAALRFGQRHLAILPFRQSGDDLAEEEHEDGFDTDMADAPSNSLKRTTTNGLEVNGDAKLTPYKASFVMPLTTLDSALTHPVDLAFLYEYREPTFGILSASQAPSQALLDQRKDCLSYQVFTLDLEQRASTNLISVPKLPSDLWKVIPVALPVGGALLVGTNEFVHIDQNGKANAVAVNEFAKRTSGFSMTDQTNLQMKLEDCVIETLDTKTGDLLIVLSDGSLAILSFRLTGRNIGGLLVTPVSGTNGGLVNASSPSCLARLDGQKLFVGSEDGNSSLLSWAKDAPSTSRKRSHAQMLDPGPAALATEDGDEAEEVDEDDLYASTTEAVKKTVSITSQTAADSAMTYRFELHDELQSLGPFNDTCLGRSPDAAPDKLEFVAAVGRGKASRLAFMHRDIVPTRVRSRDELLGARNVWSVHARSQDSAEEADEHDTHLFVSDPTSTRVYTYTPTGGLSELTNSDFDSEGPTLAVAVLANGTIFLQCRTTEIRTYDRELGLSQIIPLIDDEDERSEGQDLLTPVAVAVCDPYVLVLREGGGVVALKAEEKQGEVEMLDIPARVEEKKWIAGCLYSGSLTGEVPTMWLLDGETMALHVFALPTFERVMVAAGLPFLPPVLIPDAPLRRGAKATLTELLIADLGNVEASRPFLVLRTSMDELVFYEPFYYDPEAAAVVDEAKQAGFTNLRFRKVPNNHVPTFDDEGDVAEDTEVAMPPQPLRAMRVGGRRVIYVPGGGRSPSFIVKEPSSLPKVLSLRLPADVKAVQTLAPLSAAGCERGFALVERGGNGVQECFFPASATFETGWSVERMAVFDAASQEPREVRKVGYHEGRGLYVVATCRDVDWMEGGGQDEDVEDGEVGRVVDDISLRPQVPHYTLHLLSARTHATIQTLALPYLDTLTALKILPIEISERTHEQRHLIVATTASIRGQDTPAIGAVTVFDLIDVVPDPAIDESGVQMHLLSREETKGAVTALEGLGGGFIGTAQGMKLMVRGLKEDESCLPVAFLDAQQSFVTTFKCLGSTGLWLAGDAKKGVWIGGWTQEPYRLSILGREGFGIEVLDAEFLPMDGALGVIVADGEGALHCLQYDPEDPTTGHGQRLLHRAAFDTGHVVTPACMMLLPSTLSPFAEQAEELAVARPTTNGNGDSTTAHSPSSQHHRMNHILLPTLSGSLGLLTPITDEATYRRLSALQTQLTNLLEHAAGLNPRAYRAVDTLATPAVGSRGVLDGSLVQRISELGATRRSEVLGRAGTDSWALRSDLEVIYGGGLGYL